MIKKLWTWLTRNVGSQRPPLLQEQTGAPSSTAPPPPPPPREQAPRNEAYAPGRETAPEVPRAPRGLRLIRGEGGSTPPETPAEDPAEVTGSQAGSSDPDPGEAVSAETASTEAVEATGTDHPAVKLVFSDGSTSRLTASGPEGVRIRYLAENILPPEGS